MILGWRREPGKHLVSLDKTPTPAGPVRAAIARIADRPYPTLHSMRVDTVWWLVRVARVVPRSPKLVVLELRPISIGMWRVVKFWAVWVSAAQYREFANQSEGNTRAKHGASLERARTARMVVTVILLLAAGIYGFNIVDTQPEILYAAAVVLVAVFDAVGRHNRVEPERMPPPPMPSVLTGNVPLSQITKSILETFEREGFEPGSVGVSRHLEWDPGRMEYRIRLTVRDALKPEHLRALERAIGAANYSIRNLATDTALVRELVIGVGDPLAGARECSFIPTGSLSFTDPLPMGRGAGETPMEIKFVGGHTIVVGRTRSGKTEGGLWTMIDRFAACHNLIPYGVDLQNGPAFPMWRDVIQKVAYTPEDALELLTFLLAELDRRKAILTRLAESDDEIDDNAGTVWTDDLGPYLVLIVDEFALFGRYNGTKVNGKDTVDLMTPFEEIVRTGIKFGLHVVLAGQRVGRDDQGSTLVISQMATKILLACREEDTVRLLGTNKRDQGYAPHALQPSQDEDPCDAGKCIVDGPQHTTPDYYRFDYWPPGSVKRRARQRIADGLPTLTGGHRDVEEPLDAVEVPEALAAVEEAFTLAGMPEFMATAELLARTGYSQAELTAGLRGPDGRQLVTAAQSRKRPAPGQNPVRGYLLADVQNAIRNL